MRTNHWIWKGIGMGVLIVLAGMVFPAQASTTIGITGDGRFFTINGTPTFLNGVSYYGAQTITTASYVEDDLDDMAADGYNWIRVWMYWTDPVTDEDVSVMTDSGTVRATYMNRLKTLIEECDERGIIVDCSLTRDGNNSWVGPTNQTQHLAAIQTLASELYYYTNVYIDLSNECDVQDARYVSPSDLAALRNRAKEYKPGVLCTASQTPSSASDLYNKYISPGLDFMSPHLCRTSSCPALTLGTVKDFITWMGSYSVRMPVHLQEPFRRGYAAWQPGTNDFLRDCVGGKNADAAGWCLHNGDNYDNTPFRSFRMTNSNGRLYSQWETAEQNTCDQIDAHIGGTNPFVRRYQAEWDEQLSKQIGRSDGDARSANVAQDATGYLTYGPYTKAFPAGGYQAIWRMMIDNNTADNNAVVTIDVHDPDGGGVRATRTITRQEFTSINTYQDFTMSFTHTNASHRLEFRTLWYDNSYLKVNYIEINQQPTAPVISEVSPDPDTTLVGGEYTKQLSLGMGYPAPTWSVVSAPSGVQVSSTGYVYGWTPTATGSHTITIRATNSQGYDDESWQVTVQAVPTPYFEDTLVNNTKISGQYGAGVFSSSGYTLTHDGGYDQYNTTEPRSVDFVWYDKTGTWTTGSIEFDVSGLYSSSGCTKNELMLSCDSNGLNPATTSNDFYSSAYHTIIRKSNDDANGNTDRMKMTAKGGSTALEQRSNVLSWNGTTTYRFRMTWDGSQVRWWRGTPGQTLTEINPPSPQAVGTWSPQRLHVQLGATFRAGVRGVQESGGAPGTCYSLFRIYTQDLSNAATPASGGPLAAPVINEVSPDPQTISVYTPYTKQLSLYAGNPVPTWSVVTGPAGLTVNSNGYVSGWTPGANDIGTTKTITIRATNSQGYDDETWQVEVTDLLATYQGGSGFSHLCGSSLSNDDWRKTTSSNNCYMGYGPYTTSLPSGWLTARWWLRVDNNTYDNANICTIDVYDADAASVLATRTVTRFEWSQANVYQAFNVYFNNPGNHRIEFRTYYIWYAQLDLDKVEVLYGATNQAPSVNAGNDQTVNWPTNTASLDGTVTDDGLPNPPGAFTVTWTKQSGPGTVSFANANAVDTTATFSTTGTYVLRLTASDSALSNYDEVTITVSSCTPTLQATYQGSTGFYHQCGALTGTDDWRVTTAINNCFMAYGPYTTALSAGNKTAKWYLRVDNNTYDDANIVQIDVYDATAQQYLAGPYTISRFDFNQAGVYQAFELNFTNPSGGHQLEFRTYYIWYSQLDLDKVEVWTACN